MSDVDDLIHSVFHDIERRKQDLAQDNERINVSNKFISSSLSNIPGVNEHLELMRKVKSGYFREEQQDAWSHGYVSKAELHQRYTSNYNTLARKDKGTFG